MSRKGAEISMMRAAMYLTYVAEVGDSGVKNSPTEHLVLGAVLVHESAWFRTLDGLIDLRRRLSERYDISPRARLKLYDFIRPSSFLRELGLPARARHRLLRGLFRYQAEHLPVRAFGVAIQKAKAQERDWKDPRKAAWTFLLQRLERFAQEKNERVLLVAESDLVLRSRRLVRQMRRFHKAPLLRKEGERRFDVRRVVEDPLMVAKAEESYWLQLADWNAYAVFRSSHVEPLQPATEGLWDLLGNQRILEVSRLRGGPPGIVLYP